MEIKIKRNVDESRPYYWLAINGASAALGALPTQASKLTVHPTPSNLIGFDSLEEARSAQRACLTLPIEEVGHQMRKWWHRQDVAKMVLANPEEPTEGETMWMNGDVA